jgi:hypothetical protein
MDLGAAYYHAGDLERAETHVKRAQDLGYPCPGLALNHLACIAKARGDLDAMMDLFSLAAKTDPQHYVLIQNVNAARAWFKQNGPSRGLPLALQVRHDFQLLERTMQPTLPGPLPIDAGNGRQRARPERQTEAPRSLATQAPISAVGAPFPQRINPGQGAWQCIDFDVPPTLNVCIV